MSSPLRRAALASLLALLALPAPAAARVAGQPHAPYAAHRVIGGVTFTGNTLMTQSVFAPQVNANLLDASRGDVRDVPFDGELEAAYLFWSGSVEGQPDRQVTLTAADGAALAVDADRCVEVDELGGFYNCRADVTPLLAEHPGDDRWNGTYTVGDVEASVGLVRRNGSCRNPNCQAKYAGWSLVLVYRAPRSGTLRDVFLHDGFRYLNEDDEPGIDQFDIGGFDFPEGGQATLAFFGLEGDSFLGVPPQDTDPIQPCATCFDFLEFAGTRLEDALNPAGNVFNSSSPGGFTLGLDLDRFDVSDLLAPGQGQARIRVGSGDGAPGGGGEAFLLGWVLLDVERNAPDFGRDETVLRVVPDAAAPGERVVYTLSVSNQGSRDAPNTAVTLALPAGVTYEPGSLRVDGADPVPGDEAQNPLADGFALGDLPFRGDTDRQISLRATVDVDVPPGRQLVAAAVIAADTLDAPVRTNEAVLTVLGVDPLGELVKRVFDESGDGRYAPGENVTYEIEIANDGDRPVGGVRLVDDLPRQLDLLRVFSASGVDRSDNAAGRVELVDLVVPPGGLTVTVQARIHDTAQLVAEDGVPADGVGGFPVDNQATVTAALEQIPSSPRVGAMPAPTRFTLSPRTDIDGPGTAKTAVDLDGAPTRPGDALRFVITVRNGGVDRARVFVDDPLPAAVVGCALEQAWPGLACAGQRVQGFVDVPAGGAVSVGLTARVRDDVANGARIENVATLQAGDQRVEVRSAPLVVEAPAGPALALSKTVVGAVGGVVNPGRTLTWTIRVVNQGDGPSAPITVVDPLGFEYAAVRPDRGGVFDPVANSVTWRVGALDPGASAELTVATTLPDAVADGTRLSNQARAISAGLGDTLSDDPTTPPVGDPTRVVVESRPLLTLTKSVDRAEARPGEVVTYTFVVRNDGDDVARDVDVRDPLPPGLFAELLPGEAEADGDLLRFGGDLTPGLLAIAPGEAVRLTAQLRLAPVLDDGRAVANQAFADAGFGPVTSDDPATPAAGDPTVFTVRSAATLSLNKVVGNLNGGPVRPGHRLRYALTVTAGGDAPARDIRVVDPIPEGLIDVAVGAGGVVVGGRVEWSIDRLNPGEQRILTFTATVGDVEDGFEIINQAQATAGALVVDSDDPRTPAVDDPTTVPVRVEPVLRLQKAAEGSPVARVRPGDPVRFTLSLDNTGDGPGLGPTILDALPAGIVGPIVVDRADARVDGREIRWTPARIEPGAAPLTLNIDARVADGAPDGAEIVNRAIILDDGTEAEATVLVLAQPTLTLSKAVQADPYPGGRVVYTITARNDGPVEALDVALIDPLPPELELIGARPPARRADDGLRWALGDMPSGAEEEVRIEARLREDVAEGQVVRNQAVADALDRATGDGVRVPSDDPATPEVDATAFTVRGGPALSIEKALLTPVPPGGIAPGQVVEYAITVRNAGPGPSRELAVSDTLDPAFAAGLSAAVDGRIVRGEAQWVFDPLPEGGARVLTLRARLQGADALLDGQMVRNEAVLLDPNGVELGRSAAVEFRVGVGGLRVEKAVAPLSAEGFAAGAPVEYRIQVTNTRPVPVADVSVGDVLDPLLVDVQPLDGGVFDGDTRRVDWAPEAAGILRLVPAGGTVTVRLRARVADDAPAGAVVVNTAQAAVRGDAPVSGAARFVVAGAAELSIDKRVEPGPTDPGATVGYTITIANLGATPAEGATVFDPLPGAVRYVPGSTRLDGLPVADIGGRAPFADGLLVGRADGVPGRIAPGGRATVQFEVRVEGAAGDTVVNRARVESGGVAVESAVEFVVGGAPDLSAFTKTFVIVEDPGAERALVGQTIEWLLAVRNAGESEAVNVEIRDPLGPGLLFDDPVIIVDGAPQTAAVDGDAAEFVDGAIVARYPLIPPGGDATLRFRTVVTEGPAVRNQAFARAERGPQEPSDDGGQDQNRPTVVPVGEAPRRAIGLTKVADRAPDQIVAAGEAVRFTLRLENTGTVDLNGLTAIDTLPPGLIFDGVQSLPPGAEVSAEDTPDGRAIRIAPVDLPAGESLALVLLTRVDPALDPTLVGALCNTARFEGPGVEPADAEACVRAEIRDGRLAGAVFEDVNGDGLFGATADRTFDRMRVALYRAADPNGAPAVEVITDAEGRFALEGPPGTYVARVFTASDVLMATIGGVVIAPGQQSPADLVIDPSGRVYDSVEGTLIDGAEVFIYRDEDVDDDPFDDASRAARVLVPPDELEAASQQGQRTANGGLYRFAVRRPGRYLVEVVPPGSSFVSPSILVPPVPGTAFTDDPDGKVVPDDLPTVGADADRTYFLAFDLNTADDFFQNNHIPVDPLSSLVDVQKRSDRTTAAVGEIRSFEIDIVNRSPRDLLFDPRTGTGGVYLQDVLPRGLKYVNRTATLVRVRGGVEEPLGAADPQGTRILRFGRVDAVDDGLEARPLDLHAGEHLRLRYHVVVGADARPRTVLTNRAQLLADGNIPVSRVAEAPLRIIADPDFDQGLLLGRVWCDADQDGERGPEEPGLGGVRLYLDNGYLAITDPDGRFHFKDIDPGTHAVKLDRDGLLPGAELTTDEVRVIHFTRGLPARVGFGVTCPAERADDVQLVLAEEGVQAALDGLRERFVVLTGQADRLRVELGEAAFEAAPMAAGLYVDGQRIERADLPPGALGAAVEMEFRISRDPRAPGDRWGLYVGPVGEPMTRVAGADGPPPATFVWDQKGPDGRAFLEPGAAYAWRVEAAAADGALVSSPVGTFGVGLTKPPAPELLARFPADGVGEDGALSDDLRAALAEALPKLNATDAPLVVEAHHDNTMGVFSARSYTRRKAEAVRAALVELGVDEGRLTAEGLGGGRPLAPNFTPRNQRRNRRIDVAFRPPPPAEGAEVPAPAIEAAVRVDAETFRPGPDGRFAAVAEVPPEGVVEVLIEAADGRRAMFPIQVRPGQPHPAAAPRSVLVEGALPAGLTVGGRPAAPPIQIPTARGPGSAQPGAPTQFTFVAPGAIDGWRFVVRGADGSVARTAEGSGPPPASLDWTPPAELAPGVYRYQLTVRAGATIAQSAPGALRVGEGSPPQVPMLGGWQLAVDGQTVPPGPDGRFSITRPVVGGTPILIDAGDPAGGRVVYFAAPPTAADASARAQDTALDLKAPPPLPSGEAPPPAGAPGAPPEVGGGGPTFGAVETRPPAADRPPLAPQPPLAPARPIPADARAALADFGREALLQALAPLITGGDADVPARRLTAELPPAGARLSGRSVPVRGTTAPGNRVFLNGTEVAVDAKGRFSAAAELPMGPTEIEVAAVDPQGNRGVIRRAVVVPESGWFLLALGETVAGQIESPLAGVEDHTRLTVGDQVYVHGRAAAWFKGYMKGSDILGGIVEEYRAEVHLDTARRPEFEGAFRQLVDPEQFYPVYGDAADLQKPINTRGPLYVLLEADENRLRIGNFLTGMKGIELFRYDRALYGGALEIDQRTGDFRHRLTAFGADGDLGQRHAYVELRGTGGSLYYLPHRELVEGSEQVFLVERDRISGIERTRTPLARDLDYTVRYRDGRILMKRPVSSVTLDSFGVQLQPDRGEVLDGHPVYIAVEYDHRDPFAEGDLAAGVRASESYGEHVKVGGGWIREERGAGPAYQLWGADLTLRTGRRTRLQAEWARSQSVGAENLRSEDGGLSFQGFHSRDGTLARGDALLLRGALELDDLIGEGDRDQWYTEAYWQYLAPGFYAGGTIQEQGLEKYGGLSRYDLGGGHGLHVRHDGVVADAPETQGAGLFSAYRRDTTRAGYGFRTDALALDVELVHSVFEPGDGGADPFTAPAGVVGTAPVVSDALAAGLKYRFAPRWTALFEQEVLLRSDERVHDETLDLLTTSLGLRYQIDESLHAEIVESVRWSGANATQIGLRSEIDDDTAVYAHERFTHDDARNASTTVVGGERRFGAKQSGRVYGEYQLEYATLGQRDRAVFGIGKRWKLTDGLAFDGGYERSQVVGGSLGEFSRDALTLGVQWLDGGPLKITGRYELRYEDNDEGFDRRDRLQFLTLNALSLKLDADFTALLRLNYSSTTDLGFDATEAELLEMSAGLAWRPVAHDWVAVLVKYTKRYEQRPVDLAVEQPEREESDVVSLIPIFELPWNFQLVEKLAVRRSALRVANLPTVVSTTILWINRLNYHLTETWDAGVEYRILTSTLSSTTEHGALLELNYILQKRVRLGAGYNFTSFSDDEFAEFDADYGGPFFRVTAHY